MLTRLMTIIRYIDCNPDLTLHSVLSLLKRRSIEATVYNEAVVNYGSEMHYLSVI